MPSPMADELSPGQGKNNGKLILRSKYTKFNLNATSSAQSPEAAQASGSQSVPNNTTNTTQAPIKSAWGILPTSAASPRDTAPVAAPGQDPLPGQRMRTPTPEPPDTCEKQLARVEAELEETKKALNQAAIPPVGVEQKYWGEVQVLRRNSETFQVGSIISTPWHVPESDLISGPEPTRTLVNLGYWVYSVVRKLIVVEVHGDHCVTIPIFTYNGKGVERKPKNIRDEHVGVRDDGDSQENKNSTQCALPNIIFERSPRWTNSKGFHFMSPAAYAHFTSPAVVRYAIPCHFEGRIKSAEDRKRIVDLYCKACRCTAEVQGDTDELVKDDDNDHFGKESQASTGPWSFYPVGTTAD